VATKTDRDLGQPERLERGTAGDLDLRLDEVDPRDLLGHGVLDLDARIGLDEVVLSGGGDEKFEGPRVAVADVLGELDRVRVELAPQLAVEPHRRRDLHDLLVAALHRAVTLEQVDRVAGVIGENLHLDVPRLVDEALDEHRAVAERRRRLGDRARKRVVELLGLPDDSHPTTTAAERRLDHQWVADLVREGPSLLDRGHRIGGARDDGNFARLGQPAALGLVAELLEHLGRRTHEGNARLFALARELGPLGQKAVTGVNCIHPVVDRDLNDVVDRQVGANRRVMAAEHVRLVRFVPVQMHPVLMREDRDRAD